MLAWAEQVVKFVALASDNVGWLFILVDEFAVKVNSKVTAVAQPLLLIGF